RTGGSLQQYENFLQDCLPDYRLPSSTRWTHQVKRLLLPFGLHRRIDRLALPAESRQVLRYFIQLEDRVAHSVLPVPPARLVAAFERALRNYPQHQEMISRALLAANSSPLGLLRVYRLFQVLNHEWGVYPKIRELADPEFQLRGLAETRPYPTTPETLIDTQF